MTDPADLAKLSGAAGPFSPGAPALELGAAERTYPPNPSRGNRCQDKRVECVAP